MAQPRRVLPKKDIRAIPARPSPKSLPLEDATPHIASDPEIAPPPSDTNEARVPPVTEATWHAGPARDPQLDPVDPIDPVNAANPGGAVSEPSSWLQEEQIERKEPPGLSTTFFVILLIAVIALGALWITSVKLEVMSSPPGQVQTNTQ
jgi:hypothetical protein